MSKIGEYTEKVEMYKNIIKNNGIITEDGEVISPHDKCLDNIVMDLINSEEQSMNIKTKDIDRVKNILQKKLEQTEFQQELLNHYGSFYFNFYKRINNIERGMLFRFIYICTYMNYDNYLSNGTRLLKEDDIDSLLLLGKTECYKTRKYLIENNLIIINDNKTVSINNTLCKKGEINKSKSVEVVRMFNNAIQELYKNARPKEHKKLALLIEILPYINLRFNIVCKNPTEENIENVIPYKMSELTELLGYNKTNSSKLKKDLFSLRVNDEKVIGIFEDDDNKSIYVNPRCYYKGTKLEDVNSLINMFRVNK